MAAGQTVAQGTRQLDGESLRSSQFLRIHDVPQIRFRQGLPIRGGEPMDAFFRVGVAAAGACLRSAGVSALAR